MAKQLIEGARDVVGEQMPFGIRCDKDARFSSLWTRSVGTGCPEARSKGVSLNGRVLLGCVGADVKENDEEQGDAKDDPALFCARATEPHQSDGKRSQKSRANNSISQSDVPLVIGQRVQLCHEQNEHEQARDEG